MKIDEIIKKSIEVPGISIKRSEYSAELILKEERWKRLYDLFPIVSRTHLSLYFYKFTHMGSSGLS